MDMGGVLVVLVAYHKNDIIYENLYRVGVVSSLDLLVAMVKSMCN